MKTREETVVEAVQIAQKRQFGLTGIKVELEAKFQRHLAPKKGCEDCVDGWIRCIDCDGDGEIWDESGDSSTTCADCAGNGGKDCRNCAKILNFNDLKAVHDLVLKKLVRVGLARKIPRGGRYDNAYEYEPVHPLVYSYIYNDVTVDTEWTFTLALDNPRNILLLPKIVAAFYSLKDKIGKPVDVSTAGMHMALINDPNCRYPSRLPRQKAQYDNFRKSMILLMPALYFLGSSNDKSRSLAYRKPRVGCEDNGEGHEHAINYGGGALEFRVFETCYDKPETILDNMVVMLSCLRFWTRKYTRNYLAKIANDVPFGVEGSNQLKRFFLLREHIDLLNRGLRMIKPSYYSMSEVKKQRNFTVTRVDAKNHERTIREKIEKEYQLYAKRFDWQQVIRRNNFINAFYEQSIAGDSVPELNDEKLKKEAEDYAESACKNYEDNKQTLDIFSQQNLTKLGKVGQYRLCAE